MAMLTFDKSNLPVLIMSSSLPGVPQTMSTCGEGVLYYMHLHQYVRTPSDNTLN